MPKYVPKYRRVFKKSIENFNKKLDSWFLNSNQQIFNNLNDISTKLSDLAEIGHYINIEVFDYFQIKNTAVSIFDHLESIENHLDRLSIISGRHQLVLKPQEMIIFYKIFDNTSFITLYGKEFEFFREILGEKKFERELVDGLIKVCPKIPVELDSKINSIIRHYSKRYI